MQNFIRLFLPKKKKISITNRKFNAKKSFLCFFRSKNSIFLKYRYKKNTFMDFITFNAKYPVLCACLVFCNNNIINIHIKKNLGQRSLRHVQVSVVKNITHYIQKHKGQRDSYPSSFL